MLPGPSDAADWRVHARCTRTVLAAFAWWPAIEGRRLRLALAPRTFRWRPGLAGCEWVQPAVTGFVAVVVARGRALAVEQSW